MKISYQREGEFLIPNLVQEGSSVNYGKYGMLRLSYLKENRQGTYSALLTQGELSAHLAEIDRVAREQVMDTVEAMKEKAGVTEELKARDMLEWTGRVNALKQQAEELVLRELIYT